MKTNSKSNRKKLVAVALLLCLVLLIGGISAYFTDKTETLSNTYTIGNIEIDLTEPGWVAANAQGIMPGDVLVKDPTVQNTGSSDAYVFVKVSIPTGTVDGTADTELFTLVNSNNQDGVNAGWVQVSRTAETGKVTYVYAYASATELTTVAPNGTATLFNKVRFVNPRNAATTTLTNGSIDVTAYAIQTNNIPATTAPATVFANFGE